MKRLSAGFLPLTALDPHAPAPLRRQLYEGFRQAIADGRLRPGQRVPSTRALARELNVSRITVLSAYEQLQAEGYLQSFRGAGACIAVSIPTQLSSARPAPPGTPGDSIGARHPSSRIQPLVASLEYSPQASGAAFRVSLPALDRFPHRSWSRLVSRHARRIGIESMAYGEPMGEPAFRRAIAEYLGAVRAVRCSESQVMVTSGSQHGLQLALHALFDPGDAVWIEEPGYPGARRALAMAGCRAIPVPVNGEGLDVEEGMRRCAAARGVYITPSHQYPLGMPLSAARRIQLLNWAASSGAWILEDDYDSEHRFSARPIASLQGLDTSGQVVYIGTFSKVLFPALRMGYLVIPEDLVPALRAARDTIDIFPPVLYQRVLADFIREGHFARHIRAMRALYAQRREGMLRALKREFGENVEIIGAEAGLHLVMRLADGADDLHAARQAALAGISCMPLSSCCLDTPRARGLILGYGGVDTPEIDAAVQRLGRVLRESRRR